MSPRPKHRRWGWGRRLAVGAGALVVVAGAAVLVTLILGRPWIAVSSSGEALIRVHLSGLGTQLTDVRATSGGVPVALVPEAGGLAPADQLAQGQAVHVTASATSPSWLHWLLGSGVTAAQTVQTPVAAPSVALALTSHRGQVPATFDYPVSVVEYRSAGGPSQVVHLGRPATVAELDVSPDGSAGFLQVAAAPLPWEAVDSHPSTVTWFVAPAGAGPIALANPAPGTTAASSNGRITLTFDGPVAKILGKKRPTLTPAVAGAWSEPGPDTLVFTPSGFGFGPGAAVTVSFDRPVSVVGEATTTTAAAIATTYHFSVAPASLLRLEQILAQLHYLPVQFVPTAGVTAPTTFAGEVATMSQPLPGAFLWRWASTPAALQAAWAQGSSGVTVKGALMAFDAARGAYDGYQMEHESVAQLADASTWNALLEAAAANQMDPSPYSYVYVTQTLPETLTLWQNGSVVLTSPANTGIPESSTAPGTFPIYVRYTVNYMDGTNPDGSKYHDLVHWINYFNGGDAVHGFVRGSYGYPQSLGCVELPVPTAALAFSDLAIGDLVTVAS